MRTTATDIETLMSVIGMTTLLIKISDSSTYMCMLTKSLENARVLIAVTTEEPVAV